MENYLEFAHFHKRKEIENYLLNENAIYRCLAKELRARDKEVPENLQEWVIQLLSQLLDREKHHIQSQLISKKIDFFRKTGKDSSTITQEILFSFERNWKEKSFQLTVAPGKAILKSMRDEVSSNFGINITDSKIMDCYSKSEIPDDITILIKKLRNSEVRHGNL